LRLIVVKGSNNNGIHKRTINQLFGMYVYDMSGYALEQISKHTMTDQQASYLKAIIGITPVIDSDEWHAVWTEDVEPLTDVFIMPK